jgi:hypothetical protein
MFGVRRPIGNIGSVVLRRPEWSVALARVDQKAFGDSDCELAEKDCHNPGSAQIVPGVQLRSTRRRTWKQHGIVTNKWGFREDDNKAQRPGSNPL